MYLHCPARWLYQYHYGADFKVSPSELYAETMRAIIKYLFQLHLIQKEFEPAEIFEKWDSTWLAVAVKSELSDDNITSYRSQGYNVLTTLIHRMAGSILVLDVNIPWASEWDLFNVRVEGTIVGLTVGALDNDNDPDFCIIDCLPPHASSRNTPAAFEIFGIPREAIAREARKVTKDYTFKTQLIDPFTGDIKTVPPTNRAKQLPILGVTIQQMASKLTLPNYQNHCRHCPFYSVCDTKYLSNHSLSHPSESRAELETEL